MDRQNSTLSNKEKTPRTVSISVPRGFEKEIAHLNKQTNKSQYVGGLIRNDMNKQMEEVVILETVRQAIKGLDLNTIIKSHKE